MKNIAIIPARFESSRLPGKILADIGGKSMLSRVYNKACESNIFDQVIVATDHSSIIEHCNQLKMNAVLTSDTHVSGTDRIAEVAETVDADIIINIQGDEPFIETHCIQKLVDLMQNESVEIGTLYKRIKDEDAIFDYNVVKLVKDNSNKILYFSRQAIPSVRDAPYREWFTKETYYQHLGLYGFRKNTLLKLVNLDSGNLELSEKLEQLRWLENGFSIYGHEVDSHSFGIDTEEDLMKARAFYK